MARCRRREHRGWPPFLPVVLVVAFQGVQAGDWVTTGEAAAVLGVTHRELYRLIDVGEVPARRRGPTLEVNPWGHRLRLRVVQPSL